MPLIECGTRIGINGGAITFIFHEVGQKNCQTTVCPVDENAKRDTDLAGADGLDDDGPVAWRRVQS